jgi:flagellar hook-associated protein FlgK
MSKSLRHSTILESVTGNGATQAGLSAIAALSGGPLASLLPVLATTLASARQRKRVQDALTAIDQQLRAHESDLRNINDNQYKLINGTILALFHTTCDDKIEVLRNVVNNSMLDLPRFHGQLEVLDLGLIFHQIGDGGFAVV